MKIQADTIVTIEYTLKNASGEVLDTSEGQGPFAYLHGHKQIVPGLEKELEGKASGDTLEVAVPCADGYGEYEAERTFQANRKEMGLDVEPEVGMQLFVDTGQGQFPVVIKQVEGEQVTLDANHPLAGVDLHFSIAIKEVREASEEEKAHGHAYGEGGAHD